MRVTRIHVDRFGALHDVRLEGLCPGLNVVHGPNGAGKTTLLHLVRGVIFGFDEARQRHLVAQRETGPEGGAIGIATTSGQHTVIRRSRPNLSDTLAVRVQCQPQTPPPDVRRELQSFCEKEIRWLFTDGMNDAGSHGTDPLDSITEMALRRGIPLHEKRWDDDWLKRQQTLTSRQTRPLVNGTGNAPAAAELVRRRERLQRQVTDLRRERSAAISRRTRQGEELASEIARLRRQIERLSGDLGAIESDLFEVECELWSQRPQQPQPAAVPPADQQDEIAAIDAQVARARSVLRDLARSRYDLSLESAAFAGSDAPGAETLLGRQRTGINSLERYVLRLQEQVSRLHAATGQTHCNCDEVGPQLTASLNALRHQLYEMCSTLGRYQAAWRETVLQTERGSVDRCELELRGQIERLLARREQLVTEQNDARARTSIEQHYCGCVAHDGFDVPATPAVVRTEPTVGPADHRTAAVSRRRQGLQSQRKDCQARLESARRSLRAARTRQTLLYSEADGGECDRSLRERQFELSVVEQQLADRRERLASLKLLQTVIDGVGKQASARRDSLVLQEASTFLSRLTGGRYTRFRFDESASRMIVIDHQNREFRPQQLSRGTHDQAVLSLRLAVVNELARRGVRFPLFLDEALADSDETRIQQAVELFAELSRSGLQLIFLTCQEHLVDMFEAAGAHVACLPGTTRKRRQSPTVPASSAPTTSSSTLTPTPTPAPQPVQSAPATAATTEQPIRTLRVDAPDRYWLRADTGISFVPSLGTQMSRRLNSIGIRNVADLIDFDPEASATPLESIEVSAAQLRGWQAEARLLSCVPKLTGRDAQLLVLCGIHSPAELAEIPADELWRRVQRLRRSEGAAASLSWQGGPRQQAVAGWVASARTARTFAECRAASGKSGPSRVPRPHFRVDSGQRSTAERRSQSESQANEPVTGPAHLRIRRFEEPEHREIEPQQAAKPATNEEAASETRTWRFYLNMDSPVVDAPSIGPTTARRLERIGVVTVSDLLAREADQVARKMNHRRVSAETVRIWQVQARLMCRIPELRGHDAQVLVACGLTEPEAVSQMAPHDLFEIVGPFVATKEGQRLLRSAKTPDLAEVTDWVNWARHARSLRAA
ncbi:recombination protein F [Maioricimonas rarisocia]|uniref:Recombination protein F n=1 Tax=Maioricimonas rarisocia TaxID=2528026 RepID=A0A517Z2E7_9PLAN|nr:DUF4332 domain-containing protein [Maioricimonas rarisocia]QDU36651.1 recombination protein F [Maioricimonas rarisocia]